MIHVRRGIDLIFRQVDQLRHLPAVVFHAWPEPPQEAVALLRQGVNAWFSLGTPLLRGNRKAQRSLLELPLEHLLLETDAPWQTLKGKDFTGLDELEAVYQAAADLKKIDPDHLAGIINHNFTTVFGRLA